MQYPRDHICSGKFTNTIIDVFPRHVTRGFNAFRKKLIWFCEMLMSGSVSIHRQLQEKMFAYLRSHKDSFLGFVSNKMRTNVRANGSPLTGIDSSEPAVAEMLAEIYMREFACTMQTLSEVHEIAGRYHEHAFDNTDTYMEQEVQPVQLAPHEMTAEQRHASQVLLGVGQRHSEVNLALKNIGLSRGDIVNHSTTKMKIIADQFQDSRTVAEDAFERLNHVTKQVWSLVNMLAFSNLFRFADPRKPICIPNQDDAIFIPHIPTKSTSKLPTPTEPSE